MCVLNINVFSFRNFIRCFEMTENLEKLLKHYIDVKIDSYTKQVKLYASTFWKSKFMIKGSDNCLLR